jgi:hypothetical protein
LLPQQQKSKGGIEMMKKALRYALTISEDPKEIKKHVEEYMAATGFDRRYKFKWRALAGNAKYTSSGIFEFAGQRYYFSKTSGELELERI